MRFCCLAVLSLVIGRVCAMIDKLNHLQIGYGVTSIHQYEYGQGGSLTVNGVIDEALHVYHCTDDEIEQLNAYNSVDRLCQNIDKFECSYQLESDADADDRSVHYSFHSLKTQWMTMIAVSCDQDTQYEISHLELVSVSTNTSKQQSEYLSLNQINYKYIFLCLSIVYIVLCLSYAHHLFRHRHVNITLQSLLLLYPLLECISCVFKHLFWTYSSMHGIYNALYLNLCYIFDALSHCSLALILLLICFGWKLMNNGITRKTLQLEVFAICVSICVTSVLLNYYSSMLIFSVVCYALCARRMFKSYTQNIQALQIQIEILSEEDALSAELVSQSPVGIKLSMFKSFQKVFIGFVAVRISLYWIPSFVMNHYPWINDVILNVLTVAFIIFLFWNFRMDRPFKPYFYLIDDSLPYFSPNMNVKWSYNLSFECEMLIVENCIDYFQDQAPESNVIRTYSLSTPLTIDISGDKNHSQLNENTPLLNTKD